MGDVIVQVNRIPIRSAEELADVFGSSTGDGRVAMILEDYADCGVIWQEIDFGGRTECFHFSDEQIEEIRQLIDEL